MLNIGRTAPLIVAVLVITGCAGGSASAPSSAPSSGPSSPPSAAAATVAAVPSPAPSAVVIVTPATSATPVPAASASTAVGPTTFTSTTYRYALTLPAGWKAIQATQAWDGKGAPFHDEPMADQFVGPAAASAWFFGAPTTKDLAGRVKESITANAAVHGSTCPAVPEVKDPIDIGGERGTLLGFDCGILINSAISVHKGVAYMFGFRDTGVHAASDATDRAIFAALLKSVRYPD